MKMQRNHANKKMVKRNNKWKVAEEESRIR